MDLDQFCEQLDSLMEQAMDSEELGGFDIIGALEFHKAQVIIGMLGVEVEE